MGSLFDSALVALIKGMRAAIVSGRETDFVMTAAKEIHADLKPPQQMHGAPELASAKTRSDAVLKMLYLCMQGYGHLFSRGLEFPIVEVMSLPQFDHRRPGYLAAACRFARATDVAVLTINMFKKDFSALSGVEVGVSLSCLAGICTADMLQVLGADVSTLVASHNKPYVRKRCIICLHSLLSSEQKHGQEEESSGLAEAAARTFENTLTETDQSVLTAGVSVYVELCRADPKKYIRLVPQFYHLLQNSHNNWMTIKLIKILASICPIEPRLPNKLVGLWRQILTVSRAKSIEIELIKAICSIMDPDSGSRSTVPAATPKIEPADAAAAEATSAEATADAESGGESDGGGQAGLLQLALQKLKLLLVSNDGNIRVMALRILRLFLTSRHASHPRLTADLLNSPDTSPTINHVLSCASSADVSQRREALRIVDIVVSPDNFLDMTHALLQCARGNARDLSFGRSRRGSEEEGGQDSNLAPQPQTPSGNTSLWRDDFIDTLLRMGGRNKYELLEDVGAYLLQLAEASRLVTPESGTARRLAGQFLDLCERVEDVRPYALSLSCNIICNSRLRAEDEEQTVDSHTATVIAGNRGTSAVPEMVHACAWVIGRFVGTAAADDDALLASIVQSVKLLLGGTPHNQVVWACVKTVLNWPCSTLGVPRYSDIRGVVQRLLPPDWAIPARILADTVTCDDSTQLMKDFALDSTGSETQLTAEEVTDLQLDTPMVALPPEVEEKLGLKTHRKIGGSVQNPQQQQGPPGVSVVAPGESSGDNTAFVMPSAPKNVKYTIRRD